MGLLVFLEDLLGRRVRRRDGEGTQATPSSQWSGRSLSSARPPHAYQMIGNEARPQCHGAKSLASRNLLAHGYWTIDVEELRDVARSTVPEFLADLHPLLGDDI
jgi:Ribonuclease HepT-like